ncbi:MAG: hypothetical protein PVF22_07525 [Candidatus Aminicenantes bacterium]|jgi:hypothetical protein
MKLKKLIIPVLVFGLIVGSLSTPGFAAQKNTKQKAQEKEKEFIPKEVKSILKEGMDNRTLRTDIPFDIFKFLYLPTRTMENLHSIFFFTCKNADLGFKDASSLTAALDEQKEKKEESAFDATPAQLAANNNLFLYFKQLDGKYEKEVYVPFPLQVEGSTYDAEKEKYYTFGYPLPAGDYLLGVAITSLDLQKIGTQYYEFSLPNPVAFKNELETTPIFFASSMNRMSAVEMQTEVHQGFFTYSVLQVEPNLEHAFPPGANLDVFFFIFGAQPTPDDPNKVDIEINFSILKGEETAVRWAPQKYEHPIVSQPLPMKKTVIIKTTDAEGKTSERKDTRDLDPGAYTFSMEIKDNLSGKSVTKTVEISVVETE